MSVKISQSDDGRYQVAVAGKSFSAKSTHDLFNKPIRIAHLSFQMRGGRRAVGLKGIFILHDPLKLLNKKTAYSLRCNNKDYQIGAKSVIRFANFIFVYHNNQLPYSDFFDAEIHNTVYFASDEQGIGFMKPIKYSFFDRSSGRNKNKPVKIFPDRGTTIFIRQTRSNGLCVTSRRSVVSDRSHSRTLINLAWLASKLTFWRKSTLIFEKESSRYEESGSVLHEALIDKGYTDFRYVIDEKSNQYSFIADKYRDQVVFKNSFLNYYYFFICANFIGTESPSHAVDLRIANRKVLNKLEGRDYTYVFLQHGVFYMVSMASKVRKHYALKKTGYFPEGKTHVVISSELEAQHFIEGGGFDRQDMYLTGLPKFDRAYRNDDAIKIVIMPTWRPWEYNIIRNDAENSPYYKMLEDILNSIPDDLKKHVHILPHPLCIRELQDTKLKPYIKPYDSYDQVLQDTDLLITDYSSIAYDAFYRGTNVIFWWKEKDYCMEQYGGHLLINECNIFGDIAYTQDQLAESVVRHYTNAQPKAHIDNYRKIVEFSDNNNTSRLINNLIEDGIIK